MDSPAARATIAAVAALLVVAVVPARTAGNAPWPRTLTPLEGEWRRHIDGDVRYVETSRDDGVWLRVADPDLGPDDVFELRPDGSELAYRDLTHAVEENYAWIQGHGSLDDFWAVDESGRVWIGPAYYDGRWVRPVADDGPIQYGSRALADAEGQVWVPYDECLAPDLCGAEGIRAFTADGPLDLFIPFDDVSEAGQYGVADVSLVSGETGRSAGGRTAWAVSRRHLYDLPDTTRTNYPLLGPDPPPAPRNAGYATAATLDPERRLTAVTWVELHDEGSIEHKVYLNTWNENGWSGQEDITDAPLFEGGAEFVRVVAAAYDTSAPEEALWVASSDGEIAIRRDGRWVALFTPGDLGISSDARIRDMTATGDGRLWVGTTEGLLVYGQGAPPVWSLIMPYAVTPPRSLHSQP